MSPAANPGPKLPQAEFRFKAGGVGWAVFTEISIDPQTQKRIVNIAEEFDNVFSHQRPQSLISAIAQQPGQFTFPEYTTELFKLYWQLEQVTDGRFTPLIGKNLTEAGQGVLPGAAPVKPLTSNYRLNQVLRFEENKIETNTPLLLDFGAAGKGLLIDLMAQFLENNGRTTYTINGGGDIRTSANIRIGLEHPADPSIAVGTVAISSGALCGSADNSQRWGDLSQIIDAQSLTSPRNVVASWVWAGSAMLADGLATALHLVPPEKLKGFQFEYALIHADGRSDQSPKLPGGINGAVRLQMESGGGPASPDTQGHRFNPQ